MTDDVWDYRSPGELAREELIGWRVATLKDSFLILRLEYTSEGRTEPQQAVQLILDPRTALEVARDMLTRAEILLASPPDQTPRN